MNRQRVFILKQGVKYLVHSIYYFRGIIEYIHRSKIETCKFADVEELWTEEMMV